MRPVFIAGCQRSGSTMLGAMLGGHPRILCIPEGQFIADFMPERVGEPVDAAALMARIEQHYRFKLWGYDLAGRRPGPGDCEPRYQSAIEWLDSIYGRENAIGLTPFAGSTSSRGTSRCSAAS